MKLDALTRFLPIADLRYVLSQGLTPSQRREWAVLDTFDMFSPEYDCPQRSSASPTSFAAAAHRVTFAGYVDGTRAQVAVVRAIRN